MTEREQNELLFGAVGASFAEHIHGSNGIFVVHYVNPQYDLMADTALRGDEGTGGEEEADDAGEGQSGSDSPSPAASTSPLDVQHRVAIDAAAQGSELRQLAAYNVDRFYLGMVDPAAEDMVSASAATTASTVDSAVKEEEEAADQEGQDIPPLPQWSAGARDNETAAVSSPSPRAPPRRRRVVRKAAPKEELLPHGRIRSSTGGEAEDVQLARLWEAFQQTETSVLVDTFMNARQRLPELRVALLRELAAQVAFLLVFFSRDEVRAVSPPSHTFCRLSALHEQLLRVLRLGLPITHVPGSDGPQQERQSTEEEPKEGGAAARQGTVSAPSSFAALSLLAKTSFACFGCSHLPVSVASSLRSTQSAPPPVSTSSRTPLQLYCDFAAQYETTTAARTCQGSKTEAELRSAFRSLTPLQQLALALPFPRNASEAAVLLQQRRDAPATGPPSPPAKDLITYYFGTGKSEMAHDEAEAEDDADTERATAQETATMNLLPSSTSSNEHNRSDCAVPVKRGRGRPRKTPLPVNAAVAPSRESTSVSNDLPNTSPIETVDATPETKSLAERSASTSTDGSVSVRSTPTAETALIVEKAVEMVTAGSLPRRRGRPPRQPERTTTSLHTSSTHEDATVAAETPLPLGKPRTTAPHDTVTVSLKELEALVLRILEKHAASTPTVSRPPAGPPSTRAAQPRAEREEGRKGRRMKRKAGAVVTRDAPLKVSRRGRVAATASPSVETSSGLSSPLPVTLKVQRKHRPEAPRNAATSPSKAAHRRTRALRATKVLKPRRQQKKKPVKPAKSADVTTAATSSTLDLWV